MSPYIKSSKKDFYSGIHRGDSGFRYLVREKFPDPEIRVTLHEANNVLCSVTLFVRFNGETIKCFL